MFKVLIVDDESVIRRGLTKIVDWEALECQVCGEAADGVEGIEKIKELKPDIIVADIRMPGIEGIDMIRLTKNFTPHTKTIILTGYRDFDYIQGAIKVGAFDYILKPSKIEEITEIVRKAVEKLKEEKKLEKELENLRSSAKETITIVKEKFLYDLIFQGGIREAKTIEAMKNYGIDINKFLIISVEIMAEDKVIKDYGYYKGIINFMEDIFHEKYSVTAISMTLKKTIFLLEWRFIKEEDLVLKEIKENVENFKRMISQYISSPIKINCSSIGNGAAAIKDKLLEIENFYRNSSSKGNEQPEEDMMPAIIRRAVEYIKENYENQINLNDVADHIFVSPFYLSRLFTKELNKSFVDFLNELRIEKAKEYLRKDNYKTYEIAEKVGIKDSHYFSKLFKRYTGFTPSEFRDNSAL